MLDLERLEVVLNKYRERGYEAELVFGAEFVKADISVRRDGKAYGHSRLLTYSALDHARFDLVEHTFASLEADLARDALALVPKYEDQLAHHGTVGVYQPGLANK